MTIRFKRHLYEVHYHKFGVMNSFTIDSIQCLTTGNKLGRVPRALSSQAHKAIKAFNDKVRHPGYVQDKALGRGL